MKKNIMLTKARRKQGRRGTSLALTAILLATISLAAAATTYLWIKTSQSQTQERIERKRVKTTGLLKIDKVEVLPSGELLIFVRNAGTNPTKIDSIFVTDQNGNVYAEQWIKVLEPGALESMVITPSGLNTESHTWVVWTIKIAAEKGATAEAATILPPATATGEGGGAAAGSGGGEGGGAAAGSGGGEQQSPPQGDIVRVDVPIIMYLYYTYQMYVYVKNVGETGGYFEVVNIDPNNAFIITPQSMTKYIEPGETVVYVFWVVPIRVGYWPLTNDLYHEESLHDSWTTWICP